MQSVWMQIATNQRNEGYERGDDGKDEAAQALGKKGGEARAKKMTPERPAEIAKISATTSWDKSGK
jgi:hypothetical protein